MSDAGVDNSDVTGAVVCWGFVVALDVVLFGGEPQRKQGCEGTPLPRESKSHNQLPTSLINNAESIDHDQSCPELRARTKESKTSFHDITLLPCLLCSSAKRRGAPAPRGTHED